MKVLSLMYELGMDNFYKELLEPCSCKSLEELRKREGELIRELKPVLNKKIEGRTPKEYRNDNIDKVKAYEKECKEAHKELIKEQSQILYQNKRDYILEQQKQYKQQNPEKVKEQKKQQYEKHKHKKYECPVCKCFIFRGTQARHNRSNKHQDYLKQQMAN